MNFKELLTEAFQVNITLNNDGTSSFKNYLTNLTDYLEETYTSEDYTISENGIQITNPNMIKDAQLKKLFQYVN